MKKPGARDNTRDIVVIGASAGGVEALKSILSVLPHDFPAALFVAVHTTSRVPNVLATIIERVSPLNCRFATDGEEMTHGTIFFAPPDHHLIVRAGVLRLGKGPRENGFRPAVDVLFRSAAVSYGPRVIGVILTGNLDDGTAGFRAIKQCGGVTIAQDPAEALFPGMPQSTIDSGLADHIAPIAEIPDLLQDLVGEVVQPVTPPAHQAALETEVDVAAGRRVSPDTRIGTPSDYGCPDCGGPLRQIVDQHGEVRFRCHAGHAWSAKSLADIQRTKIEDALWTAIRWLDEEEMLARYAVERARKRGGERAVKLFQERERLAHSRSHQLRAILREPEPPEKVEAPPVAVEEPQGLD